jgi:cytochrome c oxidase subunit III
VTTRYVLDVAKLPRVLPARPHPLWFGIVGLIAIESTVFASFLTSYFYLGIWNRPWPPVEVDALPLLLPTVVVLLLGVSSAAMIWSGKGAERGDDRATWLGIAIAVGFGFLALALRWFNLATLAFRWDSHAYGSFVWTITGLHFAHVLASGLGTAVVGYLAWRGYFDPRRRLAVVADAMYWQFVVIIWIPVYVVLYWGPRLW